MCSREDRRGLQSLTAFFETSASSRKEVERLRSKLTLFVVTALTVLSLSLIVAGSASAADCVATIGIACGGDGFCCVAGFDWCMAWDCSI